MDNTLDRVLTHIAEYPLVLLALYVLTLFYPRKASYFYGTILGALVLYGLYNFNDRFEQRILHWLTTSETGAWFYSFFAVGHQPEILQSATPLARAEDAFSAEMAFTAGLYFMLKVGAILILVFAPFAAKTRVKEAIGNIGRRPAKDSPPVL